MPRSYSLIGNHLTAFSPPKSNRSNIRLIKADFSGGLLKIGEACLHRSSTRDCYNFYCTSDSLPLEGVEPNKSAVT
jgi:hypothetical protein